MSSRERRLAELRAYVDRARRMRGWSFDVRSVSLGPDLPWDYEERARELISGTPVVLDMGTGGGERFSRICEGYRGIAVATEGWPPNVPVAAARLAPMGITVLHASGLDLPLADASVDLVLNRHEGLEPADVTRVLTPEGRVLTQQIGRNHWRELGEFFPQAMSGSGDLFQRYKDGFRDAGLALRMAREHDYSVAYRTLGDVAYMLTAVPWAVPGFDVERDLDALIALEQSHGREQGVVLTHSNFVIEAEKR